MTRLPSAAVLSLTVGALAGCVTLQHASITPAVSTRPSMKMTQTDFVIRVVNYSCEHSGCVNVGQRNANLGTPGVRETIRDMCNQHTALVDNPETCQAESRCYDRATMSVGDPGIAAIWAECIRLNPTGYFRLGCYSRALRDLVAQGADVPIMSMIPGALTDQPAATAPAVAVAPGAPGPLCTEYAAVAIACASKPEEGQAQARLIRNLAERSCAEQLPKFRRSRGACAASVPSSAPLATAASGTAPSAGGGPNILLAAQVSEARMSHGLLVTALVKGSSAHKAGLRPGDLITAVNGEPASVASWQKGHRAAGLGGTLRVTLKHNGQTEDLEWTVAKCDHPSCDCRYNSLCAREGDAGPRQWTGLLLDVNRVAEVLDGPGRAAGLQKGDEVLRINEIPVRDGWSVLEIVGQLEAGAVANVVYARGGKETKAAVKLAPPPP
jgi:membrane-associated protease RseP (regulator of RpoE activity)